MEGRGGEGVCERVKGVGVKLCMIIQVKKQ